MLDAHLSEALACQVGRGEACVGQTAQSAKVSKEEAKWLKGATTS